MLDRAKLRQYAVDPVAFIDDLIQVNELGQPFKLLPFQKRILRAAFPFDDNGKLPWQTIVWSCPKKSGKTAINAALTIWFAYTQEPPNEILVCANDLEQAQSRVFRAAAGMIRNNPALRESAEIQTRQIRLSNDTTILALASDVSSAAGSNQGLTSTDELWGYVSESSRRLFEELTPVPTRKNSIRLITTYAGILGESQLLNDIYTQGVTQGERLLDDLPVFVNREAGCFMYWDNAPRMEWQTPEYYASQKKSLRPGTYARLHENKWVTATSIFLTPEIWDPCIDEGLRPLLPTDKATVFIGVDAGLKHDNAAVVAVTRDPHDRDRVRLAAHRIWRPTPKAPLDIEATIEDFLRSLHRRYKIQEILCDPYQLHRSITTLERAGLPIKEYPQTSGGTMAMGQALFELLNGKNLRMYPSDELRQQAMHTVAIESPRGWRIAKEKASRKIDAIVALSMACVSAISTRFIRQPGDHGYS